MKYCAGSDVSLKENSVYGVEATDYLVLETKVGSEPECLVGYLINWTFR